MADSTDMEPVNSYVLRRSWLHRNHGSIHILHSHYERNPIALKCIFLKRVLITGDYNQLSNYFGNCDLIYKTSIDVELIVCNIFFFNYKKHTCNIKEHFLYKITFNYFPKMYLPIDNTFLL